MISDGSGGSATLTKVGLAGSTLTLNGANTFSGGLTVSAGTLILANQNVYSGTTTVGTQATLQVNGFGVLGTPTMSGTVTGGSTTYNVNVAGTLTLDNSVGNINLPARINTTASINLTAATLNFTGSNATLANSSQTVGTITLADGNSAIVTTSGTGNGAATLTVANLVRTSGATVNFQSANSQLGSALNQVLLTQINGTASSLAQANNILVGNGGGILPWAYVNTNDFATYNATSPGGVAAYANYVSSIGASTNSGDVVKETVSEVLTGDKTIGALLLASGVTVTEAGYTLTLGTGALFTVASSTITGGTLAFGKLTPAEAIITTAVGQTTTINSVVTGSGGLTIAGTGGALTLAAANSISGNTAIGGSATLGSAASIASGNITITGSANAAAGAITLSATQALSFGSSQAVTLNNVNLTLGGTTPITFAGTTTLVGVNTLTISDTAGVYFNGQITDGGAGSPGGLVLAGAGTIFLNDQGSSNNNYLGGTLINGATVVVSDSNALGSGTIGFSCWVSPAAPWWPPPR